jgi:hypothetical protein
VDVEERRNYTSRIGLVQRLIDLLISQQQHGVEIDTLPEDELPHSAVQRILKPLALKGLVKVQEGRWTAASPLLVGVRLPLKAE